jgi:hypothetical protein
MTPTRLRACLAVLGFSQRGLAAFLECDERMVRRWAAGDDLVPDVVATWLEARAQHAEATPPPIGWQRRPGQGAR